MKLTVIDGFGETPIAPDVRDLARVLASGGFAGLWRKGGQIRVEWTDQ